MVGFIVLIWKNALFQKIKTWCRPLPLVKSETQKKVQGADHDNISKFNKCVFGGHRRYWLVNE